MDLLTYLIFWAEFYLKVTKVLDDISFYLSIFFLKTTLIFIDIPLSILLTSFCQIHLKSLSLQPKIVFQVNKMKNRIQRYFLSNYSALFGT